VGWTRIRDRQLLLLVNSLTVILRWARGAVPWDDLAEISGLVRW
jgi:hypothetical protein